MDFQLTEDQIMVRDLARKFSKEKLADLAEEADVQGAIKPEVIKELAELGFCGISTPPDYGGNGFDTISYTLIIEELSKVDASVGVVVAVTNTLAQDPILEYGSDDLKKKYIPQLAAGEKLGAFALTEPDAGCDAANTKTTAVKQGDFYILNGQKTFITNGDIADTFIIFASTNQELGSKGISAFVVERDFEGFDSGKPFDKLGIRSSTQTELYLEDCKVPAANLIGEEGQGFKIALATLDAGRISIAAQALGISEGAFDQAVEYAKTRVQFGRPISKFQAIQFMFADMATDIEASRMLIYNAAMLKENGVRFSKEAAMAKLFTSEACHRVVQKALQIHGGYGYMKEYPIERMYRDQRITELYEGTSEIQRMVISASVLR